MEKFLEKKGPEPGWGSGGNGTEEELSCSLAGYFTKVDS